MLLNVLIFVGVILFDILFWNEKMGLNTLLFSAFILGSLWYLHPDMRTSKTALVTSVITIFTACMVVWNNSLFSKLTHFTSLLITVGFVQQRQLRFLWYGLSLSVLSVFETPFSWFNKRNTSSFSFFKYMPKLQYHLRLSIIPLSIVLVFYGIYSVANPEFAALSSWFWEGIGDFLANWLGYFSLGHFLFILLGFFVVAGFLNQNSTFKNWFAQLTVNHTFKLIRKKLKRKKVMILTNGIKTIKYPTSTFSVIGLKSEYRMAALVIGTLNVLLCIVNFVDIQHVWLSYEKGRSPIELSSYVHEGTYFLIGSIGLAMGILMYYFRKNINFLPNNNLLKTLSYIWIIQNAILALSVGARNIHYISAYGLAYKRIGVFIFLVLTIIGLYTMYLKVRDKLTTYFLVQNNTWALYFVMGFLTMIDWDVEITKYNLNANNPAYIDMEFLIEEVSDKNLFILEQHPSNLMNTLKSQDPYLSNRLISKKNRFLKQQTTYSWASWNYADYRNQQHFNKN